MPNVLARTSETTARIQHEDEGNPRLVKDGQQVIDRWTSRQLAICAKYNVTPVGVSPDEKLGIARNIKSGLLPLNGVRHLPEHGTCGWYLWAGGEMSNDPDFFEPLHVSHLEEKCEAAMPFLLLPPGWRFLVAGEYCDVWFDPNVDLTPMPGQR